MPTKPDSVYRVETSIPVKVGDWLPNGAIVLQVKRAYRADAVVILAFCREEFVTWLASPDGSNCFWGHYHYQDLATALADYEARS